MYWQRVKRTILARFTLFFYAILIPNSRIEVNLDTLKVVQSRGVCNKNTEHHDQIVSLVNANRKLIRQRMRATA